MRAQWGAVAAIAAGVVLTAACGSSKSDPEPVQVRPLLAECATGAVTIDSTPPIGDGAILPWTSPTDEEGCATGPAADGDGPMFRNAEVNTDVSPPVVDTDFVADAAPAFESLSRLCTQHDPTCPTGKLVLALHGRVVLITDAPDLAGSTHLQFTFGDVADAEAFADAVNSGR